MQGKRFKALMLCALVLTCIISRVAFAQDGGATASGANDP
jgi:hypothetical protein